MTVMNFGHEDGFPSRKRHREPRILYIAYNFPPSPAIAAVRTWNTAHQLATRGWHVTVVTPDPKLWIRPSVTKQITLNEVGALHVIATGHGLRALAAGQIAPPEGLLSRISGPIIRRIAAKFGIESQFGWRRSVLQACASVKPGDFDIILATGNPFTSFGIAERLSRQAACPYVLDYRDPWHGNPHGERTRPWERHLERRALDGASAVTVVSPSWAKLLDENYGVASKTKVVFNGYNKDDMTSVEPIKLSDAFNIVYAGTLYPPKRVLDPIFRAFREIKERSNIPIEFHYFGPASEIVSIEAKRWGVAKFVRTHGNVAREFALSAQRGAGMSLVVTSVLDNENISDAGIIPGKVFECLGMRVPTLIISPDGSDVRLVAEIAGGIECLPGTEPKAIADYIIRCAEGYSIPYKEPERFEWNVIGANLDKYLRDVALW